MNRNYTTIGLNQYSAAGPATLSYDGRGNLALELRCQFTKFPSFLAGAAMPIK